MLLLLLLLLLAPAGPQPDKPAVQVQGLVKESVLLDMILHKSKYMGHGLQDSMKW